MGLGGGSSRLNIDGYVTTSGFHETGDPSYDYTQLFRNGAIEAVDADLLCGHGETKLFIPSIEFERDIIQGTTRYFKAYREIGIEGPVVAMLSFLRVRGFYMYTDPHLTRLRGAHRIDKQHLLIPEVVIEDLGAPVPTSLRPVFDLVWQACGYRHSYNYDDNGEWKPRS